MYSTLVELPEACHVAFDVMFDACLESSGLESNPSQGVQFHKAASAFMRIWTM